jgi:hypothetical protein
MPYIGYKMAYSKLDDLLPPDDNIDLNANTFQHGLLPKLPGNSLEFLRADGFWAVPPGTGGGGGGPVGTIDATVDVVRNVSHASVVDVYKDSTDGLYKMRNLKTGSVTSSATPDSLIISACTANIVNFSADDFVINSSGFAGANIGANSQVICNSSTFFTVPNGFASHVFKFTGGSPSHFVGGQFREAGVSPQHLWTAFKLDSSSALGVNCSIRHVKITNPGTGLLLLVSNSAGFVNSCYFADVFIFFPKIGVDFQNNSGVSWTGQIGPIGNNVFNGVMIQCDGNTTHGFKNIQNSDNVFIGSKTWDTQLGNGGAGCYRSTFHADCIPGSNPIIGGIMTGTTAVQFLDPSGGAYINDEFLGFKPNKVMLGGIDLGNNAYTVKSTQAIIKQGGTSQYYIRNAADSAYGNLRLENLQFFSISNQAGSVAFVTNDGNIWKFLVPVIDENYKDSKIISAPADPGAGYIRSYPKTIDSNNEGFFEKRKLNGAVVEVQVG